MRTRRNKPDTAVNGEAPSTESTTPAPESEGSAADAVLRGAAHAKGAVDVIIPGIGKVFRKSVYTTFYGVSYAVVFATLSVARLVPTNNVIGEGLRDGATAARSAVEHQEETVGDAPTEESEAIEEATVVLT